MIIFFPALFGPALPRLKPKPPKAPKKHRKETPRARYQRQQAARALNQLWWYCAHCELQGDPPPGAERQRQLSDARRKHLKADFARRQVDEPRHPLADPSLWAK